MLKADYEQIEAWVGWFLSQDSVMLEQLLSGDIHSATAEIAFKISRFDYGFPNHRKNHEWDVKRQGAKKLRYTLMYGGGPDKVGAPPPMGLGVSYREAMELIRNFWSGYPEFTKWTRMIETTARRQGELWTEFGRKMHFPVILDTDSLRQAINFPIQSNASDHVLVSALELATKLTEYNSYFLLDVHDAIWVEYDLRYELEVTRLVREVMERPKMAGGPNIAVEIKVGPNIHNTHVVPRESPWELLIPHATH
jgi:DNA polymerase-1